MDILSKEVYGIVAVVLVFIATVPYLRGIFIGKIKPHMLTWAVWTLTTGISALARTLDGAGAGAWGQWFSAGSIFLVFICAIFYGEKQITRSDIASFLLALAVIPLWLLTDNVLLAAVWVTAIDVIGYYPTFRKSWVRPHQEGVFNWIVSNTIHVLSLLATEKYTLANCVFSVTIFVANTVLLGIVIIRRRQLPQVQKE
jgi:hypothetical protein